MAGTNKASIDLSSMQEFSKAPTIILVNSQMPENIGTTARAMLNCGLTDLRLVKPREKWPNDRAIPASSGATIILDNAKLYDSVQDAIADLNFVLATTARQRDMIKTIYTPKSAAYHIVNLANKGQGKSGILFGPERSGLTNDDVALADAILNIPLNPAFSSLNLAQAVLLVGYSWLSEHNKNDKNIGDDGKILDMGATKLACKQEIENMIEHLSNELEKGGFFTSKDRKPSTLRSIRNMFGRMEITSQEVQTMRGIIRALTNCRNKAD